MLDAEGFDPALLAEGEADKKTEFDQFRNREVAVQLRPQLVIRDVCVPNDRTGVSQRDFFPFGEFVGIGEVEEFVVLRFDETSPSSLDGALHASILTIDRLRDVDSAQFF